MTGHCVICLRWLSVLFDYPNYLKTQFTNEDFILHNLLSYTKLIKQHSTLYIIFHSALAIFSLSVHAYTVIYLQVYW